jgi:subtilisin-like proprotein convertase family protein
MYQFTAPRRALTALTALAMLLLLAPLASAQVTEMVVAADTPLPVPSSGTSGTMVSTLTVPTGGTILDVEVTVDITHTFVGDLDISITSPQGITVQLFDQHGGPGSSIGLTTFSDAATTPIFLGSAPFNGAFQPFQPLTAVDGGEASGTWTLDIVDNFGGDSGTLNGWGITVTIQPPDADGDGVLDDFDVCPNTARPEATVPSNRLGVNRFALIDGDGTFDTNSPGGGGPGTSYTLDATAGCSCEQIIAIQELGNGHLKFGCSIGAMDDWVYLVNNP